MSTAVFSQPIGTGFPVARSPVFDTTVQTAISGKETRIARQSIPRRKYELTINAARSSAAFASTEYQYVVGFFAQLLGQFDTFLYQDPDDNLVIGQAIGIGDGVTTAFQLVRSFGGFIEPVLAPNATAGVSVYLNGVITAAYTLSIWGSTNPGVVNFNTPPGAGVVITANINYYWPCRMSADALDTSLMFSQHYEIKKFAFITVKN